MSFNINIYYLLKIDHILNIKMDKTSHKLIVR